MDLPYLLSNKAILYLSLRISDDSYVRIRHPLKTQILRSPNPHLYRLLQAHDSQLPTYLHILKLLLIARRHHILFPNLRLIPKLLQLIFAPRYEDNLIGNELLVLVLKRMAGGEKCCLVDEESCGCGDGLFSVLDAD